MYHSFQAILLFLATLAFASVQNADIIFFSSPGSCNRNDDWVYCSNVTAGYCCQAKGPLCARLSCDHCGGKALAVFRNKPSCPGLDQADATCTPSSGDTCCLDAGSKSICTGSYYDSNTKVRSADHELVGTPSNSTCLTPDGMVYHDAAGMRREIKNMTVDTYEKVMDLYGRGDFVALSGIATK